MTTSTEPKRDNDGKIQDIQLLRGVAIGLVLFNHLSLSATLLGFLPTKVSDPFYWGVELFFVISGYVVTLSAQRKRWNPFEFVIRRIFRLYPAILTLMALAFLTNAYFLYAPPSEWSRTFFAVPPRSFWDQSLSILGGYYINAQFHNSYLYAAMWTLSVEFQFYAVFTAFLLVAALLRIRHDWIGPLAFTCAAVVFVLSLGIRIGESFGISCGAFSYVPHFRFDFMAVGVMLAFVRQGSMAAWSARQPKYLPPIAVLLPCLILAFSRDSLGPAPAGGDFLEGGGMIITMACCAYLVMVSAGGNAWMIYEPIKRYLIRIGDVSYGLYLLHFTALAWIWVMIFKFMPWAFTPVRYGLLQAFLLVPVLAVVTLVTYRCIEVPGIKCGSSLIKIIRQKEMFGFHARI